MTDTTIGRLDELTGRMSAVEGRLGSIEQALRHLMVAAPTGTDAASPPATTLPPEAARYWARRQDRPADERVEEIPVAGVGPSADRAFPITPTSPAPLDTRVPADEPVLPVAPPPLPRVRVPFPVAPKEEPPTLESTIGRNWTSWVGGIVVVLGALFFVQYAWEQGWLALSPAARVFAAIAGGAGMLAAGEWANRRSMRVLAGSLSGAGVAIVMGALFAAHAMFDPPVLSARQALAGVCCAAAVAIWRATRADNVTLAILGLLGAYLGPLVLRTGRDESLALMFYLGALAVVGWSLCYLRPRWAALRPFVLATTAVWVGAWVVWFPTRGQHRPLATLAVSFFLAGFLLESFLSSRLAASRRSSGSAQIAAFAQLESSLATVSLLASAAAFWAFWAIFPPAGNAAGEMFHVEPLAGVALALALAHVGLALASSSTPFARANYVMAAAMVTIAVPLSLGRVAITLAWLILAAALTTVARRQRPTGALRAWAVLLLTLATTRLFTFDREDAGLRHVIGSVAGIEFSPWLTLAWAVAAMAHAMAWLMREPPAEPLATEAASPVAVPLVAGGAAVFMVACATSAGGPGLTWLWVFGAAAVTVISRGGAGKALGYDQLAGVALAVTAAKWLVADAIAPVARAWSTGGTTPPVFNSAAIAGAALIALGAWLIRRATAEVREAGGVFVVALAFAWLNVEALRAIDAFAAGLADLATAKQVALSVLWAITGLVSVVVGFARDLRPLRYAALTLLGVTLAKILLVDLAQVQPVYRILSFLAVGGGLLCVSLVYHRQEHLPRAKGD
jgi:uncharacterized membrane protein